MFCRTQEILSNHKWDIKSQRFRSIRRSHNGPIKETSLVNGMLTNKITNGKNQSCINHFTSYTRMHMK
jgi:hypothetical protein